MMIAAPQVLTSTSQPILLAQSTEDISLSQRIYAKRTEHAEYERLHLI